MTAPRVCLGVFAGAHGVKGDAKVKTFTESEDGVARYGPVETEDGARRFTLRLIRTLQPGLALVAAPEIASREDAARLAGVRFHVARARLPGTDEDEFYFEDLIGLAARDEAGSPVGAVVAVHNFGAGDLIEIGHRPDGAPALVIPFTREAVPSIDLSAGEIVVAASATLSEEEDAGLVAEAMRQEDA